MEGLGEEQYVRKMYTCIEIQKPEGEAWRKQQEESEMKEKQKCYPGTTSETVFIWTAR